MKHLPLIFGLMFAALIPASAGAQQSAPSSAQVTVIRAGTLIDGKSVKR